VADIPASTSTTSTISVGGSVDNQVDVFGDHDWFRINLTAGQQITISLTGSGANPLEDPYLNLRNSAGTIIKYNDDSGGGRNAKIVFTATTTGTY
jgi:serralysin